MDNQPLLNVMCKFPLLYFFLSFFIVFFILNKAYSQLSLCGHPAIADTPIIWITAKSKKAKVNYRRLPEINSRNDVRTRCNEDSNSRSPVVSAVKRGC